ncbi:cohesin complex subunit SCC1 [Nematocida ausubeli]|nr:cohesin complex subunit SCC1 [Nematocida ausubeli]KAI5136628.1 cohesin complex subunit SCC1 [Nematocida ausubeli]
MFYAVNFLSNKGKLSAAWVAAYFDRRLSKSDIQQVDIEDTVKSIKAGEVPELALRTSSHILLGLSRILFRKTKILYDECKELFICVKRKEPSEAQLQKTSKKQITYAIDIFKHIRLPNDIAEVDAEIEMARGSMVDMLSFQDYSMSLNNISLSLAETLSEEYAQNKTHSFMMGEESTILKEKDASFEHTEELQSSSHINLSMISQGAPSVLLDTILASPVAPRKRGAQQDASAAKKQKLDQTTELDCQVIKASKPLAEKKSRKERPRVIIPEILKDARAYIQKMYAAGLSKEVCEKESLGEISRIEEAEGAQQELRASISSELQEITQNLFSSTGNKSNTGGDDSLIEVPRAEETLLLETPGHDLSFIPQSSFKKDESISEQETLEVEDIEADLLSTCRRIKAQAFVHMLRRITDGSIYVSQEAPNSTLTIRPAIIEGIA